MNNAAAPVISEFQRDFFAALFAPIHAPSTGLSAQPAFAVYRNTVMSACIDALLANHPTVCRLVGEAWFRAAAAVFVAQEPPREPGLLAYGAGFADFLARFEPARELPYLPAVARLDRCWTESHAAADAPVFPPTGLAELAPDELGAQRLRPHPAARWHAADLPIYTIWSRNRATETPDLGELAWEPEAALLTRPDDAVQWCAIPPAAAAFLDACMAGVTLAEAAQAALGHTPDCALAPMLALLLEQGAFRAPD